jgi:hypothetical protein
MRLCHTRVLGAGILLLSACMSTPNTDGTEQSGSQNEVPKLPILVEQGSMIEGNGSTTAAGTGGSTSASNGASTGSETTSAGGSDTTSVSGAGGCGGASGSSDASTGNGDSSSATTTSGSGGAGGSGSSSSGNGSGGSGSSSSGGRGATSTGSGGRGGPTCYGDGNGQAKLGKITICHIPPGNPANAHSITVSVNALAAHLAHGDSIGTCVCDD